MCFKTYYEKVGRKEEIPVREMQERIPPEIVLELCVFPLPIVRSLPEIICLYQSLLAADYQDSECSIGVVHALNSAIC
jgi:hypothetical protein